MYLLWNEKYNETHEKLSTANKIIEIHEYTIESQKSWIEELEEYGAQLEDNLNPKTRFGVGDVVEFIEGAEILNENEPALVAGVFIKVYASNLVKPKLVYALYQDGVSDFEYVIEEQIRKA